MARVGGLALRGSRRGWEWRCGSLCVRGHWPARVGCRLSFADWPRFWPLLKQLAKGIQIQSWQGGLEIGFADPALTGQCLGLIAALPPVGPTSAPYLRPQRLARTGIPGGSLSSLAGAGAGLETGVAGPLGKDPGQLALEQPRRAKLWVMSNWGQKEWDPRAPRRILVCPDSFKGSLTATEAAASMARGIQQVLPQAAVELLPLADGGEGTLEVLLPALGEKNEGCGSPARWGIPSGPNTGWRASGRCWK